MPMMASISFLTAGEAPVDAQGAIGAQHDPLPAVTIRHLIQVSQGAGSEDHFLLVGVVLKVIHQNQLQVNRLKRFKVD
jgi:hypothetical protein